MRDRGSGRERDGEEEWEREREEWREREREGEGEGVRERVVAKNISSHFFFTYRMCERVIMAYN